MADVSLDSIIRSPGVIGAAIFDASGDCVLDQLQPPYEPILLTEVLNQLREVHDNYVILDAEAEPSAVSLKFSEGYLIIRSIGSMSLVVITGASANPAMVSVAVNVTALKLGRSMQVGSSSSPLRDMSASPAAFGRTATPPPIPGARPRDNQLGSSQLGSSQLGSSQLGASQLGASQLGASQLGASQLGASQLGASQLGASQLGASLTLSDSWSRKHKSPRGAVGVGVMRHVLKAFIKSVGRGGLDIIEEELRLLGETPATLKSSQFGDLLQTLARKIPNMDAQAQFMTAALGD